MKIKAISVLASLLLVLSMTLGTTAIAADNHVPNGRLASQIDYTFVADEEEFDSEGRLLVWVATIAGAFTGEMKWWFELPPVEDAVFRESCCWLEKAQVKPYFLLLETLYGTGTVLSRKPKGNSTR
jgi:hypothetical protein